MMRRLVILALLPGGVAALDAALQAKAMPLLTAAQAKPAIKSEFQTMPAFFDENLVRAVTLKYLDTGSSQRRLYLQRVMMNEYRSGYILERFFYESLDDYAKSGMSLRAFYPVMLQKLDVARELERWKEEGADSTRGE